MAIYIGNHVSVAKGYSAMGEEELSLGGNTFAFFTRNPRGGNAKQVSRDEVEKLRGILAEHDFGPLVAHAPYTMNLCSAKPEVREFSGRVLREDLTRMEELPGNYFNFHPGSHMGQGYEAAADLIAGALNACLEAGQKTIVLLETMAGKGTEVGASFEELQGILERISPGLQDVVGVCLDTCHVWDGGYEIGEDPDGVLERFDHIIGLERLKAVHLNDSKNVCGARRDRHEKLGQGMIGAEVLRRLVCHPLLQGRPFILETPNENAGYKKEIAIVREWMAEQA